MISRRIPMTTHNINTIRAALEAAFSVPKEEFEHAFYCQQMSSSLTDLSKYYKYRFGEVVDEIRSGGLFSDNFALVMEETSKKEVNVPLLRKDLPDLFEEIVHISTGNAAKLLSNRFIYAETKKLIGDRITNYDAVNVDDLEARLPEPEFSVYMKLTKSPKGYVVYEVNS